MQVIFLTHEKSEGKKTNGFYSSKARREASAGPAGIAGPDIHCRVKAKSLIEVPGLVESRIKRAKCIVC